MRNILKNHWEFGGNTLGTTKPTKNYKHHRTPKMGLLGLCCLISLATQNCVHDHCYLRALWFVFFQFHDVAQVVIVHKYILAKFGNIKNMRVLKFDSPFYIVGNCGDFFLATFWSKNKGASNRIIFFENIFHKIFPQKITT
jgi:hypothetical protein